ncbi:hypothetical protein FRB91_002734 [Serendipita sp. 411]|nr:hypothetical protein FRB91_002734 [Serendipita sp. 411]
MSSSGREAKDTRVRKRPGVVKPVKAPLGGVSFKWYIYILAVVTLAYSIYYAYQMSAIQRTKAANFQETLRRASGKPPTRAENNDGSPRANNVRVTVQEKIEELADMLGVQPVVLASAVANVIQPHIPAESASSLISEANGAKGTESVLSALKEGMESPSTVVTEPTETSIGGVAASVFSMVQKAGFDDMGIELD